MKTNCDEVNDSTRRKHLVPEIRNSFFNHKKIMDNLVAGNWNDLLQYKNKHKGEPAICIGSGPSLEDGLPFLKDWKHPIICSTSQAATLIKYGRVPEYVLALDRDSNPGELGNAPLKGMKLVTHPGMDQPLINFWPETEEAILFRKQEPQVAFYRNPQNMGYSYVDEEQNALTPAIKTEVMMFSCALACQLFIIDFMGVDRVFILGADFGYPDNVCRFTPWSLNEDGTWRPGTVPTVDEYSHGPNIQHTAPNGVKTDKMQIFYKVNFFSAWRQDAQQVIDCSRGTITEMPKADIKTVIKRQGKMGGGIRGFNQKQIIDSSELYMALHNTFRFDSSVGPHYVQGEEGDEVKSIETFINTLLGRGIDIDKKAVLSRVQWLIDNREDFSKRGKIKA
jgi:hypothetical protein